MTLGQLRTFVAVARAGSVRAAAASLYVSEPSVSAAVSALEREIGANLFEPHGRGLRLTAAGEELLRYAGEALGLLEQGVDAARHAARPGAGRLRLAAVTTAGEYVVPVLLEAFRHEHPEVEPRLEVGNRTLVFDRLAARQADVAIGGRPPGSRRIAGFEFAPNELILVATPTHPLCSARSVDPAALSAETWLLREEGSGTRATAEEWMAAQDVTPRAILTLGSNGAVKQAAVVGLGVTLISSRAVAMELETKLLGRVPAKGTPMRRAWHALHLDRGPLPPPARAFLTFLRSPAARAALARRPASAGAGPGSAALG